MDEPFSAHDAGTFIALTSPLTPGNLQISGSTGAPIVTIHHDGRVELNPAYSLDEAARAFWDAVIEMNPVWRVKAP
jgi:hypothetical protein